MHGHSRRNNVFMYGCNRIEDAKVCRVFPLILSKLNPLFSFEDSRFGVQKDKAGTARVALFNELKTENCIYTMESTFCGADFGDAKGFHLTTEMLQTVGKDLCRALLV